MNNLQIELTRLIGKKELTNGCLVQVPGEVGIFTFIFQGDTTTRLFMPNGVFWETLNFHSILIIGNPATLSDFHRWIILQKYKFRQFNDNIIIDGFYISSYEDGNEQDCWHESIPYDSSKYLLDQDEETLKQIVELIKYNQ